MREIKEEFEERMKEVRAAMKRGESVGGLSFEIPHEDIKKYLPSFLKDT